MAFPNREEGGGGEEEEEEEAAAAAAAAPVLFFHARSFNSITPRDAPRNATWARCGSRQIVACYVLRCDPATIRRGNRRCSANKTATRGRRRGLGGRLRL